MVSRNISILFFLSGMAAIIYQIVWQRLLFASFGTDIESITIIVSVFMFGLGLGSLIGGRMSDASGRKLLYYFIGFELSIGIFGLFSNSLIEYISTIAIDASTTLLPVIIFGILFIPTFAMGATLPVLVSYLFKKNKSVGDTVSRLYYINTLGSAIGCLITVAVLFVFGTRQFAIYTAVGLNFTIAFVTYLSLRKKDSSHES